MTAFAGKGAKKRKYTIDSMHETATGHSLLARRTGGAPLRKPNGLLANMAPMPGNQRVCLYTETSWGLWRIEAAQQDQLVPLYTILYGARLLAGFVVPPACIFIRRDGVAPPSGH